MSLFYIAFYQGMELLKYVSICYSGIVRLLIVIFQWYKGMLVTKQGTDRNIYFRYFCIQLVLGGPYLIVTLLVCDIGKSPYMQFDPYLRCPRPFLLHGILSIQTRVGVVCSFWFILETPRVRLCIRMQAHTLKFLVVFFSFFMKILWFRLKIRHYRFLPDSSQFLIFYTTVYIMHLYSVKALSLTL
jgi:hypothetical protein